MDFVQNWVLYRTCLWGYNTKRLVQAKSNDSYAHSITMGRTTECSPDVWRYWCIRQEYRKGAELGDQAWELENQQFSSDHCRKCARRLLNNGTLREAFDPVLEVPGLRDGMRISTLNKLFGTRCYEVCLLVAIFKPNTDQDIRRQQTISHTLSRLIPGSWKAENPWLN